MPGPFIVTADVRCEDGNERRGNSHNFFVCRSIQKWVDFKYSKQNEWLLLPLNMSCELKATQIQ